MWQNRTPSYPNPIFGIPQDNKYTEKYDKIGEMTGYSPYTSRWYGLSIIQIVITVHFSVFGILFLIDSLGTHFMNQWATLILWSILGGVVIVLIQGFFYIMLVRENYSQGYGQSPQSNERMGESPSSYLGAAHMKELFLAFIISLFVFVIGFWIQLDWLQRFEPGTCSSETGCHRINAEDMLTTGKTKEYITFRLNFMVLTVLCFAAVIALLRAIYTHFNPLTSISGLYWRPTSSSQEPSGQYPSPVGKSIAQY